MGRRCENCLGECVRGPAGLRKPVCPVKPRLTDEEKMTANRLTPNPVQPKRIVLIDIGHLNVAADRPGLSLAYPQDVTAIALRAAAPVLPAVSAVRRSNICR
jgi:hypothetical protein